MAIANLPAVQARDKQADQERQAFDALRNLLQEARRVKLTHRVALVMNFNQGGVVNHYLRFEEDRT